MKRNISETSEVSRSLFYAKSNKENFLTKLAIVITWIVMYLATLLYFEKQKMLSWWASLILKLPVAILMIWTIYIIIEKCIQK
jgi:hypothetical protein